MSVNDDGHWHCRDCDNATDVDADAPDARACVLCGSTKIRWLSKPKKAADAPSAMQRLADGPDEEERGNARPQKQTGWKRVKFWAIIRLTTEMVGEEKRWRWEGRQLVMPDGGRWDFRLSAGAWIRKAT